MAKEREYVIEHNNGKVVSYITATTLKAAKKQAKEDLPKLSVTNGYKRLS